MQCYLDPLRSRARFLACATAGAGLIWAWFPCTAAAQLAPPGSLPTEIEIGAMPQRLNNGQRDWHEAYVDFSHRFGERETLYGSLRETERFGRSDTQGILGGYYPLGANLTGVLEADVSPTHKVLPKASVFGQLEFKLGSGWGIHSGVRHTEYDAAQVNTGNLTVERYFGNFLASYTWYESWLQGAGASPAQRVALTYFYNDENQISFALANGREAENVGPPRGVLSSSVANWAIYGRHWFTRDLALSFEAQRQRQGDLYIRQAIRLGLRYRF